MKIHELNGDQLAEALCLIAEPIERITQDEEVSKVLADIGNKRKENTVFRYGTCLRGVLQFIQRSFP